MVKNLFEMKSYLRLTLISFLLIIACEKNDDPQIAETENITKEKITGFVQKGPFISGTSILMNELDSELVQTGKIFTSSISNDTGLFELNNIELGSSFVEFTSSGFYFNEVSGQLSSSQLTLTSLSDIKDKTSINVNVLTHLEKKRVETLIKEGKSFSESKKQSRNELLSAFSMSLNNDSSFEDFDISENTEAGSVLLGISIILQGNRNVGQLTELLSKIQNDFSNNGVIDDENTINTLLVSTSNLSFEQIRQNIKARFTELNITSPVPDFENQLLKFLSSKNYPLAISIEGEGTVETNPLNENYSYGTVVELTPVPSDGWVFESWGGDLNGNEAPKQITMNGEKNITAIFRQPKFTLADNGITCVCENVNPGDKGFIDGVEFEAVDNDLLRKRRDEGVNMTKLCTSLVTDMSRLFQSRTPFNQPIGNWDVSNVTDMSFMFSTSPLFNQDIKEWNVGRVTDMRLMFYDSRFNQIIENWDVGNVTNMGGMFERSPFNRKIENWNVSKVENMGSMFSQSSFNQSIGGWDVSKVDNMGYMFAGSPFNQPIGDWDVSKVKSMQAIFAESSFNQPIGNWDVSRVEKMGSMFSPSPFNQPIEGWDVSNVVEMGGMFNNSAFNQPLGGWDVSNCVRMSNMFSFSPFNQNISNWCVTLIETEPLDFSLYSPLSTENLPVWGTCPE